VDIPQRPYFLFAGRLMKIKGVQTLIPVFRQYDKAALLVAGTGRYEAQLHRLAEGSSNIHFVGQLPYGQLRKLYQSAVALIVPSIAFEVAALVIIESFREGTPVIARNLGGMREHVVETGGGIVYDTDAELIAAMDQLLAKPSLRRKLGQQGRQTYLRFSTPEAHVRQYMELIRSIAATRQVPTEH
jgi:glycosyltransferase involved in cell wall biosynthesis